MTMDQNRPSPLEALRIPQFRSLVIGRFIFIMGLRMMSTLVGWWIYNLTNAPLAIGIVGLSEFIPAVSLALYAGHIIDISEKRKMMLTGVGLYAIAALLLLSLSVSHEKAHMNPHWVAATIYIIIFGTGVVRSFTGPIFNVMLAQVVPKEKLQNAITWNTGVFLSASITGHAMGGFLIAGLGNSGTLVVIVLLVSLAFVILTSLKKIQPLNERGEMKTWDSVKEGLAFRIQNKGITGCCFPGSVCSSFWRCNRPDSGLRQGYSESGRTRFWFIKRRIRYGSCLHRYPADGFSLPKKTGQETATGCCRIWHMYYHFWYL